MNAETLRQVLADAPGNGWLRGIGYHESVLGSLPDAAALDRLVPDRPLRLQHRSGRMWLLNSAALSLLLDAAPPPAGLERIDGCYTGRLFDEDDWLRNALGSTPPDFSVASMALTRMGVTGLTDMSPRNGAIIGRHFTAQRADGHLHQRCVLAGTLALADAAQDRWRLGPAKLHLHEASFPDFDDTVAFARRAHAQSRAVAVHCGREVELVFALAVIEEAGVRQGDRIEHVSVANPELLDRMASLGLQACVQPHFIQERGDRYLTDVEPRHHGDLYRLRTLADRGIPLVGGSDAPYGSADPWSAMRAAVTRRTSTGRTIGSEEALSPEQALGLYLADPLTLTLQRQIALGEAADLCLLDRPWKEARLRLTSDDVMATVVAGKVIHYRIDETPRERLASADPAS